MENNNKNFPCEMEPNKLSRGYYENKPFTHPDAYRVFRSPTFQFEEVKVDEQNEKDELIRKEVEDTMTEMFLRMDTIENVTDEIMKIVKKGYGI